MMYVITYERLDQPGVQHTVVATSREHLDVLDSLMEDPDVEHGSVYTHRPVPDDAFAAVVAWAHAHPIAA